jgi:Flp pilus assembly protein TadD
VADAALAAGAPEVALRVADLVLERQPQNVPALIARGDALYAMRQRDSAREAYRAAIAIDSSVVGAQVGLGRTLAHSNPREAEAAFLVALAHDPDNVIALNNLGVVRDLQGRGTEAQEAYEHALAVAPVNMDVRINLGMSLALSGRRDEAVRELREVAATPDVAWRDELVAGLTLAGDGAWAKHMLASDPTQAPKNPMNPAGTSQPVLAATPSPVAPRVNECRVAATTPPANGGSYGGSPPVSADRPDISQSLVAEMPPSIKALAPDRPSIIVTDLPPIGSAPSDASPVAIRPIVTVLNQPAARPSFRMRPMMQSADTGAGGAAPSGAEVDVQTAALRAVADERAMTRDVSTTASGAFVQIASLLSEPDALFEWHRLSKRLSQFLPGREPTITPAEVRGRAYWRLRTFGFVDIHEANDLCGQIKAAGFGCWTGQGL